MDKRVVINEIKLAQRRLLLERPSYGLLLAALDIKTSHEIPTAATDGKTVWVNPRFIVGWTIEQIVFLLAHEALHVALLHIFRRNGRDKKRWNVAGDMIINRILIEDGLSPPPNLLCWDGEITSLPSTERLYNELPESTYSALTFGDDISEPNGSATEIAERKHEITGATINAGFEPNHAVRRYIETQNKPIRWQSLLEQALVSGYNRFGDEPNGVARRHVCRDMYFPAWKFPTRNIAIAVDTSGSVSMDQLSALLAETREIIAAAGGTAMVIYADCAVHSAEQTDGWDSPVPLGGGGTDFSPALEYAEQNGVDLVVYLTDGLACIPPAPSIPVVWGIIGETMFSPGYGETIAIQLT